MLKPLAHCHLKPMDCTHYLPRTYLIVWKKIAEALTLPEDRAELSVRDTSPVAASGSEATHGVVGRWGGGQPGLFEYGRFAGVDGCTSQPVDWEADTFYSAVASRTNVGTDKFVWVHYLGDSLLRGAFLHAAALLGGARLSASNPENYHFDRVACCSAETGCVFEIIEPDAGASVWGFVDEFAAPESSAPRFCLSFSWTPRWERVEKQLVEAGESGSAHWPPHTFVMNPALHEVLYGVPRGAKYNLAVLREYTRSVLARIAALKEKGFDTQAVFHSGTAIEAERVENPDKREHMAVPIVARYNDGLREALNNEVAALRAHEWVWYFDALSLTLNKALVGGSKDGLHYTAGGYGAAVLDADMHIGFGAGRWCGDAGGGLPRRRFTTR